MNVLKGALAGAAPLLIGSALATSLPSPRLDNVTANSYTGGQAHNLQVKPGAVWRSFENILSEQLNPRDYGAVMDGVTDDTAALQAMQAAAQSAVSSSTSSVKIYFPAGRLLTSAPLTLTAPSGSRIAIDAAPSFQFITAGDSGAISITTPPNQATSQSPIINMSNLAAIKAPGASNGGDAFSFMGNAPMAEMHTANIRCQAISGASYQSCLHVVNVNRSTFSDTSYEGAGAAAGSPLDGAAIWIDSTPGLYSVDDHIDGLQTNATFTGVLATNHVEGLQISKMNAVGSAYCVMAPGMTWPGSWITASVYDWISVQQTHCSTNIRGIYGVGGTTYDVSDSLFYSNANYTPSGDAFLPVDQSYLAALGSKPTAWAAASFVNAKYVKFTGNGTFGFLHNSSSGLSVTVSTSPGTGAASSSTVLVDHNIFSSDTAGETIDQSVTHGSFTNNLFDTYAELHLGSGVVSSGNSDQSGVTNSYAYNANARALFLQSTSGSSSALTYDGTTVSVGGASLSAAGNIISGRADSFITTNSAGDQSAYVGNNGYDGVIIGTLKSGAAPTLDIIPSALASLPTCTTAIAGFRASVYDASSPSVGTPLTGGGAAYAPAFCNGSRWIDQ